MYSGYTSFFNSIHTRGALAFFTHFPSSRYLKGYTKEMLVEEMKQHTRIFRMDTAEKILRIVRANIVPYTNEVVEESIKDLIQDILDKEGKIKRLEELLTPLLKETGYQLQTIPGVSTAMAGIKSYVQKVETENYEQIYTF